MGKASLKLGPEKNTAFFKLLDTWFLQDERMLWKMLPHFETGPGGGFQDCSFRCLPLLSDMFQFDLCISFKVGWENTPIRGVLQIQVVGSLESSKTWPNQWFHIPAISHHGKNHKPLRAYVTYVIHFQSTLCKLIFWNSQLNFYQWTLKSSYTHTWYLYIYICLFILFIYIKILPTWTYYICIYIWVFPKIVVPPNHPF